VVICEDGELVGEVVVCAKVDVLSRVAVTSTVTGGAATLMMEYPVVVTVEGVGESVTNTVSVDSGPSMLFVITM